jgi:HK97 family phage prohead protease
MAQEFRTFKTEVRNTGDRKIVGYASVFNTPSQLEPGLYEVIAPTAFDSSLQTDADVMARWNHDDQYLLGRTSSGTLKLSVDSRGLAYEITPPNTSYANDLKALMVRGDVSQASFAFIANDEQWSEDSKGNVVRTITDCQLIDIAPVNRGQYPQATSSIRSQAMENCPAEFRSIIASRQKTVTKRQLDTEIDSLKKLINARSYHSISESEQRADLLQRIGLLKEQLAVDMTRRENEERSRKREIQWKD